MSAKNRAPAAIARVVKRIVDLIVDLEREKLIPPGWNLVTRQEDGGVSVLLYRSENR